MSLALFKVSACTANTFYLLGLENLSESEIILDNMVLNPWGNKKSQGRWPGASDGNVCSGEAIPASLGQGYARPSLNPQLIVLLGLHILTQTHTHTTPGS